MTDNLKAVILAAGKGKRLNSEEAQIPKHMREIAEKPILQYVLDSINFIKKENIIIVVGYLKEMIMKAFPEYTFAIQDENNSLGYGTGAAIRYTENIIRDYSDDILVLMGDSPLIKQETLISLCREHKENNNDCTNLSCENKKTLALGRIIRDKNNNFLEIIENKDCTEEQKTIKEYNTGNAVFNSKKLFEQLKNLNNNNKSGEYYLTDIPKLFYKNNYKVGVYKSQNSNEIYGANSIEELELIKKLLIISSTK